EPLLHRARLPDGPSLVHLHLLTVVKLDDDLVHLEGALLELHDLPAAEVRRDHDAMLDVLRFLDRPYDVPGNDGLALLHLGGELHVLSRVSPGDLRPRRMKSPIAFLRTGSGRCIPS